MAGTIARCCATQPESRALAAGITPWSFPAAMIAPLLEPAEGETAITDIGISSV